jgi:ribosomal protein L40E
MLGLLGWCYWYYIYPVYWLNMFFFFAEFVLFVVTFHGFFHWELYAWYTVLVSFFLAIPYFLILAVLKPIFEINYYKFFFVWCTIWFAIVLFYYIQRKPLFNGRGGLDNVVITEDELMPKDFCIRCGEPLQINVKFCLKCGAVTPI